MVETNPRTIKINLINLVYIQQHAVNQNIAGILKTSYAAIFLFAVSVHHKKMRQKNTKNFKY